MTAQITNFNVVDFSDQFTQNLTPNKLLTSLGIFGTKSHDTAAISFDTIVANNQSLLTPNSRYGSDYSSLERAKASLHQITLPHFLLLNQVDAAAWQGKRRTGSQEMMTQEDVVADFLQNHRMSYERTLEKYLADSLFRNSVNTAYTESPTFSNVTEFGLSQGSATIAWATATTDIADELDQKVHAPIRTALGDKVAFLKGLVCVCGSGLFSALKTHPKVKEIINLGSADQAKNPLNNFKEELGGFQSFVFDDITFVVTHDADHGIASTEGYFFPILDQRSGVMVRHAGPASRHAEVAAQGGKEIFQYTVKDQKWGTQDVVAEFGILPVNMLPNIVIKTTVS